MHCPRHSRECRGLCVVSTRLMQNCNGLTQSCKDAEAQRRSGAELPPSSIARLIFLGSSFVQLQFPEKMRCAYTNSTSLQRATPFASLRLCPSALSRSAVLQFCVLQFCVKAVVRCRRSSGRCVLNRGGELKRPVRRRSRLRRVTACSVCIGASRCKADCSVRK